MHDSEAVDRPASPMKASCDATVPPGGEPAGACSHPQGDPCSHGKTPVFFLTEMLHVPCKLPTTGGGDSEDQGEVPNKSTPGGDGSGGNGSGGDGNDSDGSWSGGGYDSGNDEVSFAWGTCQTRAYLFRCKKESTRTTCPPCLHENNAGHTLGLAAPRRGRHPPEPDDRAPILPALGPQRPDGRDWIQQAPPLRVRGMGAAGHKAAAAAPCGTDGQGQHIG